MWVTNWVKRLHGSHMEYPGKVRVESKPTDPLPHRPGQGLIRIIWTKWMDDGETPMYMEVIMSRHEAHDLRRRLENTLRTQWDNTIPRSPR